MYLPRGCYPFDGSCDVSKEGDITLIFDNGTTLKASSSLLKMASPVLNTALNEYQHNWSLHLSGTSKEIWIFILNCIHPACTSVDYAEYILDTHPETTVEVLKQCQKYDLASIYADLDQRLSVLLGTRMQSLHEKWAKSPCEMAYFNETKLKDLFLQLELPRSEKQFASYLIRILKWNVECLSNRQSQMRRGTTMGGIDAASFSVSSVVSAMHDAGRHEFCSYFAKVLLDNKFFMTTDNCLSC